MSLILARNCKVRLTRNCHCAKCPVFSHVVRDWISPNAIYKYLFLHRQQQCICGSFLHNSHHSLTPTHTHAYPLCACVHLSASNLSFHCSFPTLPFIYSRFHSVTPPFKTLSIHLWGCLLGDSFG